MSNYPFEPQAVLQTAETIARQAGSVLREYYERPRQYNHKRTVIDLVTEADTASEKVVVSALREAFPDHHIHGEEGGGYGPDPDQTPFHWWVDPLDGTTNFAHRFPIFAVSIALSDAHLNPILGVIYDPLRDEAFKAIQGHGATLNGRPLHVSEVRDLSEALVVTGFAYDRWTAEDNNTERFSHFVRRTQGARRAGSAALDLAYVASGRCDMYWEAGPKPWDVQAGLLCVLEAGGKVTDFAGEWSQDAQSGTRILASNGHVHDQAVTVIRLGGAAPRPQSK